MNKFKTKYTNPELMQSCLYDEVFFLIQKDIIGNPVTSKILIMTNFSKTFKVYYDTENDEVYRIFKGEKRNPQKTDIFLMKINYAHVFYDKLLYPVGSETKFFSKQTNKKIERLFK